MSTNESIAASQLNFFRQRKTTRFINMKWSLFKVNWLTVVRKLSKIIKKFTVSESNITVKKYVVYDSELFMEG